MVVQVERQPAGECGCLRRERVQRVERFVALSLDPPMRWSVEDWVIRKRAL
jgi:hypothetical protein